MKKCFLSLVLLCAGCGSLFPVTQALVECVDPPEPAPVAQPQRDMLQPARSMEQLLVYRLAICTRGEEERAQYVAKQGPMLNADPRVDEEMLDALLVASCTPAKMPGVMSQLLADLTAQGTWPEDYAAFFDLLIAGQRAYALVEKMYTELKESHENTIQGLSEIESQIELQSTANP